MYAAPDPGTSVDATTVVGLEPENAIAIGPKPEGISTLTPVCSQGCFASTYACAEASSAFTYPSAEDPADSDACAKISLAVYLQVVARLDPEHTQPVT